MRRRARPPALVSRTGQPGSKTEVLGTRESPPPGPTSSGDPTSTLQEQASPALRDSVIGPSLCSCNSWAGWVGACEVCAPGSAWEVCHPRSPAKPPPRATEGDYPASFAGFTQRLGFQSRLRGSGRRAERAVSPRHPRQPHTCRPSLPFTPPFCLRVGGYRQGFPKGGQQPTQARPA